MSFTILSNDINNESLEEDLVAKEFDLLDTEVDSFTEHHASIKFVAMSEDEARAFFNDKKNVESYWVDLKYSLAENDGTEHHYRNRFAYISYNANFPVAFGSLLQEDSTVRLINSSQELQTALKEVVSEHSFIRSLLKAKRGRI